MEMGKEEICLLGYRSPRVYLNTIIQLNYYYYY